MRYITVKVNSEIYLKKKRKKEGGRGLGKIPCNINLGTFHRRALSSKYNYSLKGFICRAVLFFENNLISLVNIFKIILLSSVTVMQKPCILHVISFYDNDAVVIIKKKKLN